MISPGSAANPLDDIVARLRLAVRRRCGETATIERVEVATLGGSNRTILFDLVAGNTRRRLVFRQETFVLDGTPFLAPHAQFELLNIAHRHGIPVPEPVFEVDEADALGRGYVVACVDGETMPKRLLTDAAFATVRQRFAAQAGEILARLHAIAPALAGFLAAKPDSIDPLAAQQARYESYHEPHPAIEVALRWLDMHRPAHACQHLVHGDFRNGNLILGPDAIRAVLDWECAHLGSGIADLAWLCLRSWRFGRVDAPVGGFGARADLYSAYAANGGERIDDDEVYWWEIFGLMRWAILNMMQAYGHVTGARRALPFAACGRNTCTIEYDLLMTMTGRYR